MDILLPPPARTLVTTWRDRSGADLSTVYLTYRNLVLHRLRERGVPDENLDDLAQDVWGKVLRALGSFDTSARLEPWLLTIADRVAMDHSRVTRTSEGQTRTLATDDFSTFEAAQPDFADHIEDEALIHDAIARIPARHREAVHLSFIQGLSARDAGRALGLNENAFRQLLHRACKAMRPRLIAHGFRNVAAPDGQSHDRNEIPCELMPGSSQAASLGRAGP